MTTKPADATLKPPSQELRDAATQAAEAIDDLVNAGGNKDAVAMTLAYLMTVALDEQRATGQGERQIFDHPTDKGWSILAPIGAPRHCQHVLLRCEPCDFGPCWGVECRNKDCQLSMAECRVSRAEGADEAKPVCRACERRDTVEVGSDGFCMQCRATRNFGLYAREHKCRACGQTLVLENFRIADGCPCNSPRGINHGLVPVLTCTCEICDPAATGGTRASACAPVAEPPLCVECQRPKFKVSGVWKCMVHEMSVDEYTIERSTGWVDCPTCGALYLNKSKCSNCPAPVAEPPSPVAPRQEECPHGIGLCTATCPSKKVAPSPVAGEPPEYRRWTAQSLLDAIRGAFTSRGWGNEGIAGDGVLPAVESCLQSLDWHRNDEIPRLNGCMVALAGERGELQSQLTTANARVKEVEAERKYWEEQAERWQKLSNRNHDDCLKGESALKSHQREIAHALGLEHATDTVCEPADWPTLEDGARSLAKTYHSLVDEFMARGSAIAAVEAERDAHKRERGVLAADLVRLTRDEAPTTELANMVAAKLSKAESALTEANARISTLTGEKDMLIAACAEANDRIARHEEICSRNLDNEDPATELDRLNPFKRQWLKQEVPAEPLASFLHGIRYYAGMLEDDDNWSHGLGHIESLCVDFDKTIHERAGKPYLPRDERLRADLQSWFDAAQTEKKRANEANARAERLAHELKSQQANNRQRNIELDAVGYVWCSGGCASGTRRFTEGDITAEHVAAAMRNTERMLSNFVNRAGREDKTGTINAREPLWEKAKRSVAEALERIKAESAPSQPLQDAQPVEREILVGSTWRSRNGKEHTVTSVTDKRYCIQFGDDWDCSIEYVHANLTWLSDPPAQPVEAAVPSQSPKLAGEPVEQCSRCGEADATEDVGSLRWCRGCLDAALKEAAEIYFPTLTQDREPVEQQRAIPGQMWFYAESSDAESWQGPHCSLADALEAARSDYTGSLDSFWVDEAHPVDWDKVLRGFVDADDLLERFGEYAGDNEHIEDPEPEFKTNKAAAQDALETWAVTHLSMRDYWQCIGKAAVYPVSPPATPEPVSEPTCGVTGCLKNELHFGDCVFAEPVGETKGEA